MSSLRSSGRRRIVIAKSSQDMRRCQPRQTCLKCPAIKAFSTSQSQPSSNMEKSKPSTKRIHILGIGNLGRLFAHALANSPNPPPISLLFHRPTLISEWEQAGMHFITIVYIYSYPITKGVPSLLVDDCCDRSDEK